MIHPRVGRGRVHKQYVCCDNYTKTTGRTRSRRTYTLVLILFTLGAVSIVDDYDVLHYTYSSTAVAVSLHDNLEIVVKSETGG